MPTKPLPLVVDPFQAADDEIRDLNSTENAASPEHSRPPVDPFQLMRESTAFEFQRSIRALGIILMRVERAVIGLKTVVEENTAELKKHPTMQRRKAPR
jgi:hypothetical protein